MLFYTIESSKDPTGALPEPLGTPALRPRVPWNAGTLDTNITAGLVGRAKGMGKQ